MITLQQILTCLPSTKPFRQVSNGLRNRPLLARGKVYQFCGYPVSFYLVALESQSCWIHLVWSRKTIFRSSFHLIPLSQCLHPRMTSAVVKLIPAVLPMINLMMLIRSGLHVFHRSHYCSVLSHFFRSCPQLWCTRDATISSWFLLPEFNFNLTTNFSGHKVI